MHFVHIYMHIIIVSLSSRNKSGNSQSTDIPVPSKSPAGVFSEPTDHQAKDKTSKVFLFILCLFVLVPALLFF